MSNSAVADTTVRVPMPTPEIPTPEVKKIKPRQRSPLGLPTGSVRSLLTFCILAVVICELISGHELEIFWSEVMVIALAHYFSSRKFIDLPYPVLDQLAKDGHISKEVHPLWLPRHSMRVIILAAFGGAAYYLHQHNMLLNSHALTVLGTVGIYIFGVCFRAFALWWHDGEVHNKPLSIWDDLKALIVLGVVFACAGMYLYYGPDAVPKHLRTVAVAMVLFYFGSR